MIREKTRMSTFATFIQHNIGNLSHNNQRKNQKKKTPHGNKSFPYMYFDRKEKAVYFWSAAADSMEQQVSAWASGAFLPETWEWKWPQRYLLIRSQGTCGNRAILGFREHSLSLAACAGEKGLRWYRGSLSAASGTPASSKRNLSASYYSIVWMHHVSFTFPLLSDFLGIAS